MIDVDIKPTYQNLIIDLITGYDMKVLNDNNI